MKLLPRLLVPALLLAAPLAHAQTPAAADSLKGRVWTATARRIWADTKPRAPLPPAWPTYAAFTSWLGEQGNSEKSGIGLLRGDVARQLGTGRPATAAQVASAILAEAANPPHSRAWLGKLDQPALQAALRQVVPQVALPPLAAPDSARPVGAAPLSTNDSTLAAPPPATTTMGNDIGFFGHHPLLSALLGALLGALLTYALLRSLRRRSRRRRSSPVAESTLSTATLHASPQDSAEVLRLQNEVQRLAHYIKELEGKLLHYENGNAADVALSADAPALEPPVAPAELPHPPAAETAVPPAASAAPVARYGPVPETPYLEDRKLVAEPLPQLALLLSPDPAQPDEADFTLNPQVNQAMLIGDGLERLQHFFDYDAPPGRISLVEGAAPGRLQRQGDGWQVLERGWLHIS